MNTGKKPKNYKQYIQKLFYGKDITVRVKLIIVEQCTHLSSHAQIYLVSSFCLSLALMFH